MRLVGVREAQAQLSGLVSKSQKEWIILTRHGKPVAALSGVEGMDVEDILLGQDRGFVRHHILFRVVMDPFEHLGLMDAPGPLREWRPASRRGRPWGVPWVRSRCRSRTSRRSEWRSTRARLSR